MSNPISQIKKLNKPFSYFHTHVIDRAILDSVLESRKSLEIDVCMYDDGTIYVGHPVGYYTSRNLPLPSNVPLETIVKEAAAADLFLCFDCKHIKVLPKIKEMIELYGVDRCLVHAFIKELSFKPWPAKVMEFAEPHWPQEEMPLDDLLRLKAETGVPLLLSCHGITRERLETEGESIMNRILELTKGRVESINFFLPKDEIVPMPIMQQLLDNNILPLVGDRFPMDNSRPAIYLGSTDHLELASNPQDFK